MSDFDFEFEGAEKTFEAFRDLRERYDGDGVEYIVGTTVEYAVYLEFGTEKMPPYSWFRPAVREFRANPEKFLIDNSDLDGIDTVETAEELVSSVAFALQSRMEDNVNAQDAARDRSPGVDPEHPRRQSGNLTASIQAVRIN